MDLRRALSIVGCLVALFVLACSDGGSPDAGPVGDRPPPPGTYACGDTYCSLDTQVCVFPRLADARCEPRLDPMGMGECRVHVDAYCAGSGDRCLAPPDVPDGEYTVLCL